MTKKTRGWGRRGDPGDIDPPDTQRTRLRRLHKLAQTVEGRTHLAKVVKAMIRADKWRRRPKD